MSQIGINPTGYFDSRSEYSMVVHGCILTKIVYNHGLSWFNLLIKYIILKPCILSESNSGHKS